MVSPVPPKPATSSWEALGVTASVTPTWAALPPSIWGNGATSVTDTLPYIDTGAGGRNSMEPSPEIRATPSPPSDVGGFDPFSTMGSIWNPTCGSATSRGGNTGSPWGFPPKPDHMMD
ncbi:hypothetical protein LSAT2_002215 [Lamellibrachia satsuma]|nr:hypothetical protein LSAT2_002215 [Lamellibrachia satsuma]